MAHRLPHNITEAREWARLKTGERYWIAKAFMLGYRDKPPGDALVIGQKLYDDAWRLGRKCRQYEREAKEATRGSKAPTDAYYRKLGLHPLRVRVSGEVIAMVSELAEGTTKAEAVSEAVRAAYAKRRKTP